MPWVVYMIPAICIVLGIPMILRVVPRNRLYGFRTPATLSGDATWYEANHIAGKDLVIAGLVQLGVLWSYPLIPGLERLLPRQLVVATQVPILLVAIAHSFWRLRRM